MGKLRIAILLIVDFVVSGLLSWVVYSEANRVFNADASVALTVLIFVALFTGPVILRENLKGSVVQDERIDEEDS